MHGLFDRLRIGREQTKPDPLESARARIGELTEALQGLVDLSDSSRVRDFAEVKRPPASSTWSPSASTAWKSPG
jgi:hypothetical protein